MKTFITATSASRLLLVGLTAMATGASAGATYPEVAQQLTNIPLAAYNQGQAMMQQAMSQLKLDARFTFLNKDYENDKYVRDPVTGQKVRVSCVRFKADSGFHFKLDPPNFQLRQEGLVVTQNIAKIRADGLTARFQLGPCAWVGTGLGVQLTNVKYVYRQRPMLKFEADSTCKLVWDNQPDNLNISIGDLNIIGVQNDLDKLAKDATREAINASLNAYFGSILRGELQKVVVNTCGSSKVGVKIK